MSTLELFASCAPGLEAMLLSELERFEIGSARVAVPGGVEFRGALRDVHRANRWLGIAQQLRVRVAKIQASKLPELARKSRALDWAPFIDPTRPVKVHATTSKSRLYHSGAVAERVHAGLALRLGVDVLTEGVEPQKVHVGVRGKDVVISVDASGDPLHRRGYRLQGSKAPLREDLAHALVLFSGWDRSVPLFDPMMGSGTILIEAARLQRNMAPGAGRGFAADRFPAASPDELADAAEGLDGQPGSAEIWGSDRDAGAVKATAANAERAGITLDIRCAALSNGFEGRDDCAIITNPPYGRRVGRGKDLRPLFQTLGRLSAERTLTMVAPSGNPLFGHVGRDWRRTLETRHGGARVSFASTR